MNTLSLRNLELGSGRPKIAVSLTGETETALLSEVQDLHRLGVELAEWRIDCFAEVQHPAAVLHTLSALREALQDLPLLATFRTAQEGGRADLSPSDYSSLLHSLIEADGVDLLDVEFFSPAAKELIQACHEKGLPVLLSSHDFSGTPSEELMLRRLEAMAAMGGDVLKLAVMPQSAADVAALLSATAKAHSSFSQPLVTISMGALGSITRVAGETFGSCLTFASAASASAPGQLPVEDVAFVLDLLQQGRP